jgi:hypothetical protein
MSVTEKEACSFFPIPPIYPGLALSHGTLGVAEAVNEEPKDP